MQTLPARWLVFVAVALAAGCGVRDERRVITIWHQSRPAESDLLAEEIARYEADHPGVRIRALYKETEELRSGFQAAALAGTGPELIYGPSDVLDTFHTMGLIQDLAPWVSEAERGGFVAGALTFLPARNEPGRKDLVQVGDRFGNHLALVYNRRLVPEPPRTTAELVKLARENTVDADGDGRRDRYGLVWNFTEPFFAVPFLTGFGGWVFREPDSAPPVPALDTPAMAAALAFIRDLREEHRVAPANCDYELADSLFKTGRAAMIINGDWSWSDYLAIPEIDAAVAVLPVVDATGEPMRPLVAPKGYSLNANATGATADAALAFVRHVTGDEAQRRLVNRLRMLPARKSAWDDPLVTADATLAASRAQLENGRLMPVATELRAVWDGMRPSYQALLGGALAPEDAAARMQADAERFIDVMHRKLEPGVAVPILKGLTALGLAGLLAWQWPAFLALVRDLRPNRTAYLFAAPAVVLVFAVIVFPFFSNLVLSLSDMSLARFRDWRVVGLQNYAEVLSDPRLWGVTGVFVKTLVWTLVNVVCHVAIGILLAVALNGPVRGKALYRLLLVIPWAVPAYITALTWRGMFDYEYGAVNLVLGRWLGLGPVNWLGEPLQAFEACILTNVWLGFPFMMVIALGGMQGIPQELYEAARIDRASRWQQFWHITLPLLKPVLLPAVTLGAIWTFNNLNVVWLVSNGGEPQDSTHILVSYVYKSVFNLYRYGYGAALSTVMFLILLAFSLVFLQQSQATESVYR
jgi:arabinogalactan oligomer/maltooligosaccharide transport system permease protein